MAKEENESVLCCAIENVLILIQDEKIRSLVGRDVAASFLIWS